MILDNLEALAAEPLHEAAGRGGRLVRRPAARAVLCTTRRPEFGHAAYRIEGTLVHRRIPLAGLGSRRRRTMRWSGLPRLSKLPPAPTVPAPQARGADRPVRAGGLPPAVDPRPGSAVEDPHAR